MIDAPESSHSSHNAHARRDEEKMRLHRAVAQQLLHDPERVLAIARANLRRWRERDADSPYYEKWEDLLRTLSVQDLADIIVADSDEARRLRQSTPFVRVVPREERDRILGVE